MSPPGLAPPAGATAMPVGLFVATARLAIERAIGPVWVAGEVSGFLRAASGHCYFTLKDAQAQVRCVLWRQKAQLLDLRIADGMAVEVRATPTIYEARGDFQLNVDTVRLAGQGALYEKFARLKAKLEAAGWFASERKRPLPAYPRAVGLVTSPQGAALHDMLTTFARRWPALRVVVYPTPVQGDAAPARIVEAIRVANERAEVDVLIVGRGGGSIEDLWAFNDEAVARAVFDSGLPVVSAIGHETDFTICDFVADVRAPTPTGAAALVAPDGEAIGRHVGILAGRLARAGRHAMALRAQRLDLAARGLVHPRARLDAQRDRLGGLVVRLAAGARRAHEGAAVATGALAARLARELGRPLPQAQRLALAADGYRRAGRARHDVAAARLATLAQSLAHLNPSAVLDRGYAIVTAAGGRIVHDAATLGHGDEVTLTLARGDADATVDRVRPETSIDGNSRGRTPVDR
ncbi:Exodeoxyribonuclease 7 large subunit [Burkholderiales bacterium]|nr:Exodeoxyribonuclease 7 large subunit [Burkholderiales bacterium]